MKTTAWISILLPFFGGAEAVAAACGDDEGVAVQVLGSGGPIADDARASSGYLVWVDGRARALVDAGGGVFLRFGEAGARFEDLEVVALSHLHTDHSAALPALLKSGNFAGRERPLPLVGPGPGGPFPGVSAFTRSLLDDDEGAYGYLAGYLDGSGRLPLLDVMELPVDDPARTVEVDLPEAAGLSLDALPVPHGIVPALGLRVTVGDRRIVFGSDQNGSNPAFADFAAGADLLVLHLVIPEDAGDIAKRLHATPTDVGRMAAAARPARLVLSHFMSRSLRHLDQNVARVREHYKGELSLAVDLACYAL
ncbi:MAG: MBL fold metallo-hydrolase [Woeseiaceae bacterium]|jgi:ribonuclease BN (tRNA processing enzyme)|nr:MBL fold metallo-hydrolase [Woeseiaceae bacterium]